MAFRYRLFLIFVTVEIVVLIVRSTASDFRSGSSVFFFLLCALQG
ncbi:hypothetical protein DAI22_02g099500 [Oryza sativa Japonica Group]|nr:hypothetical protein DAI22_02g099500 [Oryza sativa Japonica Group]